jgi:tetratricopeptide (TPR) repeat protein
VPNEKPAATAAVARNALCPCGSGKRYKECHGALSPPKAQPVAGAWIPAAMRQALQAQREGRVVEAAQIYRNVLAADPANFDATHMLGLVEYEVGDYDQAVSHLRRAIELRPDLRVVRKNLRLLESLPMMEIEVCREALPRVMPRVDASFDPARLGDGRALHVVSPFGEAEAAALGPLTALCASGTVKLWQEPGAPPVAQLDAARLTGADHPRGGWVVLLGAEVSTSAWLAEARADGVLVVATRDQPCAVIDRIDELAAAGFARPGLRCATPLLARRLGLPLSAALPSSRSEDA